MAQFSETFLISVQDGIIKKNPMKVNYVVSDSP